MILSAWGFLSGMVRVVLPLGKAEKLKAENEGKEGRMNGWMSSQMDVQPEFVQ